MKENPTTLAQVHMLPTDKANLHDQLCIINKNLQIATSIKDVKSDKALMFQHLYATSSEEIKEGDWRYNVLSNKIDQHVNSSFNGQATHKKVVATTNPELWGYDESRFIGNSPTYIKGVSKIPTSFLKPFIDSYNAGTPITEVKLETETIETTKLYPGREYDDSLARNPNSSRSFYVENKVQLKLRADNSVIVHPVKEKLYTRAEFKQEMLIAYCQKPLNINPKAPLEVVDSFIDWFNEHYPL